jgi:putative transposase
LNIKQISISNKNNKFYLNIIVDDEQLSPINNNSIIGIDIGLHNIYATSDGELVKNTNRDNLKYLNKQINKLKARKDKCKRGSRKNKYLASVVKRLHEKKYRKTNDFLHKISYDIKNKADVIVVEDLSIKCMSESEATGLNRNIRDNCLGKLIEFIKYKAKRFISINPYNTSKCCSSCGNIKTGLLLSDRTYVCDKCGISINRDINAAINILCLGQASV